MYYIPGYQSYPIKLCYTAHYLSKHNAVHVISRIISLKKEKGTSTLSFWGREYMCCRPVPIPRTRPSEPLLSQSGSQSTKLSENRTLLGLGKTLYETGYTKKRQENKGWLNSHSSQLIKFPFAPTQSRRLYPSNKMSKFSLNEGPSTILVPYLIITSHIRATNGG